MPRGRPVKSEIRQNIIEILHFLGEGYGYQIAKIYNEIFPQVTLRSVYYHLRKGVQTKELEVHNVKIEKGDYSWGDTVEKVYYSLGGQAEPRGKKRVQKYIETWKQSSSTESELIKPKKIIELTPEIPEFQSNIEIQMNQEEHGDLEEIEGSNEPKKRFEGLFSRFRKEHKPF